jgi:hypothetical protein
MALSKAEWQRRKEEDDARPSYFGLTRGEFNQLSEQEQEWVLQMVMQLGATDLGYWKDCALGKCRRARRCAGFVTQAQARDGYNTAFPPRVRKQEPRRAEIFNRTCELLPDEGE